MFLIQLGGFLFMSISCQFWDFSMAILEEISVGNGSTLNKDCCVGNPTMFVVLFGLILCLANVGPNSTTFIVPAEFFPPRFHSTCHGISAAVGKAGAIIGVFVVQSKTSRGISHDIKKAVNGTCCGKFK